jgi:hypothetical protein
MTESTRASSAAADDLLRDFRGRGLMGPLLVTVLVHAVLILATSVPYLRTALGGGKADLTEEQRLDAAVKQATASLQEIAKEHGVRPQDLGSRFSSGGKPAAAAKAGSTEKSDAPEKAATARPDAGGQPATPAGQAPAAQQPAADAPPAPPAGPALPEVKDDVDLFK